MAGTDPGRMTASIHEDGGAGTCAAAFRAGIPQAVIWHMGDQPAWGKLLHKRGVAVAPLRQTGVTPLTLANFERLASDGGMRERAAALGAQVLYGERRAAGSGVDQRGPDAGDTQEGLIKNRPGPVRASAPCCRPCTRARHWPSFLLLSGYPAVRAHGRDVRLPREPVVRHAFEHAPPGLGYVLELGEDRIGEGSSAGSRWPGRSTSPAGGVEASDRARAGEPRLTRLSGRERRCRLTAAPLRDAFTWRAFYRQF